MNDHSTALSGYQVIACFLLMSAFSTIAVAETSPVSTVTNLAESFFMPQTCALAGPSTIEEYNRLDHEIFRDAPDPIVSRATAPFEDSYTLKLSQGVISGTLTKTFCQIGATRLVVDMTYSVEDDSVSHITSRAIYDWVSNDETAGWQLSQLGQKSICARGRDVASKGCL